MMLIFLLICFIRVRSTGAGTYDYGKFWQLTDIHYDANYSSKAVSPSLCRSSEGLRNSSSHDPGGGLFGDYNCDSPWSLVTAAIKAMKDIEPNPDFILWTGDSVPHVPDAYIDMTKALTLMKNVTDLLCDTFPGIPIFPTVGNHDVWPAHQIPGRANPYYSQVLQIANFNRLLTKSAAESFKQGGYYSATVRKNFRVVSVNSNLWYTSNHVFDNSTGDPANQFSWLELQLTAARQNNDQVLLMGHIPPGKMGRSNGISWLKPKFNQRFHTLLQRYSDIIIASVFGHEHTDGFRVVYDHGVPVMSMFLAPAVTPWYSSLPGIGSNNPGIRLYSYIRNEGQARVSDYSQYFINLTAANVARHANFVKEYQATTLFAKPDVSPGALDDVIKRFRCDPLFFDRYYTINSVSQDTSTNCSDACKVRQICAALEIDFTAFYKCVQGSLPKVLCTQNEAIILSVSTELVDSTADPDSRHGRRHSIERFTYFIIGGLMAFIAILFIILAFCCCRRRHAIMIFSRPKYILIQEDPVG